MSNQVTLSAATQDRKARLAQLKSLKRKQPQQDDSANDLQRVDDSPGQPPRKRKSPSRSPSPDVTQTYLSGRNYDAATRGPKLGFENAPTDGQVTLEAQAKKLELEEKQQRELEDIDDKPLDISKLQPKKPNWDLKRDLQRRMEGLNARTDNAIARLVRERIKKEQDDAKAAMKSQGKEVDHETAVGMEGLALLKATHQLEEEDREERARLEDADQDDEFW